MIGKNYNFIKNLKILLSLIFIDQTYITLTFPLITLIFFDQQSNLFDSATTHAVRSTWYGFCVALPNFINMFFSPLVSSLSDQFGRKKILLIEISSAIFFTSLVGLGVFFGKLWLVFMAFLIRGIFSRTNPTALAMIGDMSPRDKKILYMGYLQFAISVGAFIGPIIGGYFASRYWFSTFNFSLPFFLAAVLAVINTILAFCFMRETLNTKTQSDVNQISWQAIKDVLIHPEILRISLLLLLIQIAWSTYYQFIPPILKTLYQIDSHTLGWFIGMIAFWLAIATSLGVKLLCRFFDLQKMLVIALYLILFGFIITLLACHNFLPKSFMMMWLGAIPIAAGDVISYSCITALYSNAVSLEKQGKAMGVSFIVVGFVWSVTGFVGGLLMSISLVLPLMLAFGTIILALFYMSSSFGKKLAINYQSSLTSG